MAYRGQVRNGKVILKEGAALQEGTVVEVHPMAGMEELPTLAERSKDIIRKAADLPPDMAENHDHALHGRPERHPR